jgi:hypothetical protein
VQLAMIFLYFAVLQKTVAFQWGRRLQVASTFAAMAAFSGPLAQRPQFGPSAHCQLTLIDTLDSAQNQLGLFLCSSPMCVVTILPLASVNTV